MTQGPNGVTFTTEEVCEALQITRMTVSRKIKQLRLDLKKEKITIQVIKYHWSKTHIKKLIDSIFSSRRREEMLALAKEKGLI